MTATVTISINAQQFLIKTFGRTEVSWSIVTGGGNNRSYLITTPTERYLLKEYFVHKRDLRDRFTTELTFSKFLWDGGIRNIPQIIASDRENSIALFQFIEGRPCTKADIGTDAVSASLEFLTAINHLFKAQSSHNLPLASEPCFTFEEHAEMLKMRLARLASIENSDDLSRTAIKLISESVVPVANKILDLYNGASQLRELSDDEKILSPSDFGFHNALITPSGTFYFLDFEYAGIDDPARLIADFFCQPKLRVDQRFFDTFIRGVGSITGDEKYLRDRTEHLFPIYKMKWICIALNEFLPVSSERREFAAHHEISNEGRKIAQIELVRILLSSL